MSFGTTYFVAKTPKPIQMMAMIIMGSHMRMLTSFTSFSPSFLLPRKMPEMNFMKQARVRADPKTVRISQITHTLFAGPLALPNSMIP